MSKQLLADLRADLRAADETIQRQRAAFRAWRDLLRAVADTVELEMSPTGEQTVRLLDRWRESLSPGDRECFSRMFDAMLDGDETGDTGP